MNKLLDFFNLSNGEDDKATVLENVTANISFRGANLWILACAIVVASIGLNVNSTAVIIGAMLISPLMGPIMGAGFALGTYNFELLKKSLKNLANATLVSLIVSTLYFFLSPFKETQSELLARTSPNIYDVLIAFFGGLVGVIAITRKEKGNPIPGVAIATALMPPLCTAGYGLAIGNLKFFAGAMYLYTINCVFICVATFAIVKLLEYPRLVRKDKRRERQITYVVTFLIFAMLVPSVYFAYRLFEERKFEQRIERFLANEFTDKGQTIVYKKTRFTGEQGVLELALLSKRFSREEIAQINEKLPLYNLRGTKLLIRQDTTDIKEAILSQLKNERQMLNEKDLLIARLQKQIAGSQYPNSELLAEAKILFPGLTDLSLSDHKFNVAGQQTSATVAIYAGKAALSRDDTAKLRQWLSARLKKQQVLVFERR